MKSAEYPNGKRTTADGSYGRRCSFELFKSNVCHSLKRLGDIGFLAAVEENGDIWEYYKRGWYPECLYMLAMVDYISRENGIALNPKYDCLRCRKLSETVYPAGVLVLCAVSKSDTPKKEALEEAIPEFLRFNIVEAGIRDVC